MAWKAARKAHNPVLRFIMRTLTFYIYSHPEVDRIWGIWADLILMLPKAIFYLHKGEYDYYLVTTTRDDIRARI